jgi:kynurenine formamidase
MQFSGKVKPICDICVMNAVKDKMLSRRDMFRGLAAIAAAATVGAAAISAPAPAMAGGHSAVTDMTHELSEDFPSYFGEQAFFKNPVMNYAENKVNLFNLRLSEHIGTHIDAPLHFTADGNSVAEIPVSSLVAPLCVVDIAARACVAMHSGWADKVATDGFRNMDAEGKQHYPGFHPEATQMLMEDADVASIAVDTLSLDYGASATFDVHYQWLPSGRFGIENIANLDKVPASGATLVVGAPKIKGGTGGPARIFAMV